MLPASAVRPHPMPPIAQISNGTLFWLGFAWRGHTKIMEQNLEVR